MLKIIYLIIRIGPDGYIYVYTMQGNNEKYKVITRNHVNFTWYKQMNKLYIRQKN